MAAIASPRLDERMLAGMASNACNWGMIWPKLCDRISVIMLFAPLHYVLRAGLRDQVTPAFCTQPDCRASWRPAFTNSISTQAEIRRRCLRLCL
jgi:hypothetical protein